MSFGGTHIGQIALWTLLLLLPGLVQDLHGQDVTVDIRLSDPVTQAQVLGLSTLGVDRRGEGQSLGTLLIQNNTSETQDDLYLHVKVESTAEGTLVELDQKQGQPFSLSPNQTVQANNNRLQEGLPGIDVTPTFSGGLTNAGEDFVNDLEGQTQLPNDEYTLTLAVYQGSNRPSGGQRLDQASATVGSSPSADVASIYVNRPGGEVGSGLDPVINTQRPTFDWAGESGLDYRLVVVQSGGQDSPETLIESAEGTGPILVDNNNRNNTLLEHEMADVRLSTNSFQYPSSSVKQLQPGQTYLWRVSALVQTAEGENVIPSEIWRFSIAESQSSTAESQSDEPTEMSNQMEQALRDLVGSDQLSAMQEEDMSPQSVIIDGQEYSGAEMERKLNEFLNRARRGEITIANTDEQP